ncbi:hypothetical protein ACFLT5_04370 [Chloroflexota bacterium]
MSKESGFVERKWASWSEPEAVTVLVTIWHVHLPVVLRGSTQ